MSFQDGLTGSAWGDWALYTYSPLSALESGGLSWALKSVRIGDSAIWDSGGRVPPDRGGDRLQVRGLSGSRVDLDGPGGCNQYLGQVSGGRPGWAGRRRTDEHRTTGATGGRGRQGRGHIVQDWLWVCGCAHALGRGARGSKGAQRVRMQWTAHTQTGHDTADSHVPNI